MRCLIQWRKSLTISNRNDKSCQPCGCDEGAGHICAWHSFDAAGITQTKAGQLDFGKRYSPGPSSTEKRIIDPLSGGEKGQKIERFDLIPPEAMRELASHYGRGCAKYEDRNWERGYKWGLSVGALQRHLHQWLMGESYDQETGSHHLIAVAWHAFCLFTFELRQIGQDDVRVASRSGRGLLDRSQAVGQASKVPSDLSIGNQRSSASEADGPTSGRFRTGGCSI